MRKLFKKTMALLLTSAMAITGAVSFAPDNAKTAKAANAVYNAYTAFQVWNTFAARESWVDSKQGLNGGETYIIKKVGNTKNVSYNYLKQILVFNGDAKEPVIDAGIKDAKLDQNGTYVMEMTNLPLTSLPLINAKKGDKDSEGNTITEDTRWNMLHISTDIPVTMKNVKCTNVKVYFDDETTPFAELANAPYNTETETTGNAYDFFIFDSYWENHETKGVLNNEDAKYKKFPSKSMKIEFTISGVDFGAEKKDIAVDEGLQAGQTFSSGDLKYKVLTRSKTDGTKGEVAVAGVSTAAAKKSTLTIPSTAANGKSKYNVTSIAKEAFSGNKVLKKVTIGSSVKSVGASAFKKCTKLTGVTYNKKITSVGTSVFEGCTSLSKITLGSKVKSIKKSAFKGCKKLSAISVSQKVKVTKGAFTGCKKTIKVSGKKANKTYTVDQIKKSGYKKVK